MLSLQIFDKRCFPTWAAIQNGMCKSIFDNVNDSMCMHDCVSTNKITLRGLCNNFIIMVKESCNLFETNIANALEILVLH